MIGMRFFLLTFYVIILSITVHAQKFSGGLRGGINFAQMRQELRASGLPTGPLSTTSTSDSRTGYLIGIYYTIMFSEKVGLQPELFYNSMGSKVASSEGILNYASLPVFVRYNLTEGFHLLGGPQVSYLVSAEEKNTGPTGVTVIDTKDSFTSMDFGIVFGLGLDLGKINLGVRYITGFTNITKNPTGSVSGVNYELEINNRGWQILAGYRLFGK
jgi:hypothetical protein